MADACGIAVPSTGRSGLGPLCWLAEPRVGLCLDDGVNLPEASDNKFMALVKRGALQGAGLSSGFLLSLMLSGIFLQQYLGSLLVTGFVLLIAAVVGAVFGSIIGAISYAIFKTQHISLIVILMLAVAASVAALQWRLLGFTQNENTLGQFASVACGAVAALLVFRSWTRYFGKRSETPA